MASPARPSRAAGVFLAIGAMLGAFIGARENQASAGLLIGLAAGAAIALALWLWDRRQG